MRGFGFESTAPVNKAPSGYRTAAVIGVEHRAPERAIAKGAAEKGLDEWALDFKWRLFFAKDVGRLGLANARQHLIIRQTQRDNSGEIRWRKWAHRGLRIGKIALDGLAINNMGHGGVERQIAARFDKGAKVIHPVGIGNDLGDLGNGKEAF